jgi:hypothetical protein
MHLDVFLQPNAEPPRVGDDYEYVCPFDADEGYYWFLHPLFEELRAETGEYINLYDRAVFSGDSLEALARTLSAAHSLVAGHPES